MPALQNEDLAGSIPALQDLLDLREQVHSGDPQNIEAQAARRYWLALFGENFRRDRDADDQNRLLNYGYAILRATVARAICAAGLHPSLGLHHHNRYDTFCLASDLMEPFRPLVDNVVVQYIRQHGSNAPLDKAAKAALLAPITARYTADGESRTLFDLLARVASSLTDVYMEEGKELYLPELLA
ncbi:MAG: type II CRISPR-associated endonuclease Cas1 [Planctomycetota bacterium]